MKKKLFWVVMLILNALVLTGCITDNEISESISTEMISEENEKTSEDFSVETISDSEENVDFSEVDERTDEEKIEEIMSGTYENMPEVIDSMKAVEVSEPKVIIFDIESGTIQVYSDGDSVVGNNSAVFIYSPVKIKKVVSGTTEANPIDTRYDYSYGLVIGEGYENLEVSFTIIDFYNNEYEFTFYYTSE